MGSGWRRRVGDNTARVWDAVSGQTVTPPLAHQDGVIAVA